MTAGAVYRPFALMEPVAGEIDQITAVLAAPVTVATNCWVWPGPNETVLGKTATATEPEALEARSSAAKVRFPNRMYSLLGVDGSKDWAFKKSGAAARTDKASQMRSTLPSVLSGV